MEMPGTNANLIFGLIFLTAIWNIECAFSGPSLKIVKQIGRCNSTEGHTVTMDKYRINKYNTTVYTYDGTLVVLEDVGDEGTEIFASAEVWGNGGWRKNFFKKRFQKACSTLRQLSPNYAEVIFQQANITGCPIPQGTYVLKDLEVNIDISVPVPYGLYRVTAEFLQDSKVFFCMVFVIEIIPKD